MFIDFFKTYNSNKWIGFGIIILILGLTIGISNRIVQNLKKEEQHKIETYAGAVELIGSDIEINSELQDFLLNIINENRSMPVLLMNEENEILEAINVSDKVLNNPKRLQNLIDKMKELHSPIEVDLIFEKQYVYYENSSLLTKLKYYPAIIVILVVAFLLFSYWYSKTLKKTEQGFLWAGMAKETAHQIGTPLSSLMGWIEILKLENASEISINEMEKDIDRLKQITERFSKIGYEPEFKTENIVAITKNSLDYLRPRLSKGIQFDFSSDEDEILVPIDVSLYSWVIENLMKNSADAMQNKGNLSVFIKNREDSVVIKVKDSGLGIAPKLHKKIFKPGYTTKKRGWGLGLSLAKRIVEDHHKGKIFVAKSSKSGTEIHIELKKSLDS